MITNLDFFDVIDTEEKAYWLGFIYADGSVHLSYNSYNKGYGRLKIAISSHDKDHLDKIAMVFGKEKNIYTYYIKEKYEVKELVVSNKDLYNHLIKLGMPERNIDKLLCNLQECFFSDFVRGYFDGDGCIHIDKTLNKLCIDIACSSKDIAEKIQDIITSQTGLNKTKIKKQKGVNCYYIRWSGNTNATKFYCWIYNNAEVYLPRKKHVFEEIIYQN